MANLQKEFEYYLAHQNELVKEYRGKYLVIKDQQVKSAHSSEIDAYKEASEKYPLGTFLIQLCEPGSESVTQTFYSRVAIKK